MTRPRTLIVGGGIAGLATAAGLARAGIACEVVERAPAWAPVGAGIVLSVNAMAVMRRLGLDDAVAERGTRLGRGAITDAAGRELGATDFALLEPELGPTIALHRAALHEVLLEGARDVPVAHDASVEALRSDEDGVDVTFTDGREHRYDLVVGADGLRSRVRELLFGPSSLAYSGYTCWRFVVKSPVRSLAMREMWGRGRRLGIVPIGEDSLYAFAVANAPPGADDPPEGRLDRLRERFAGFGGQAPDVLAALQSPDQLIHNDLEERPEGPWHAGRVLLIGDAAHAMTPNMGQGAAMALEDAAVLVELLAAGASPVSEVVLRLVERRRARVRWVQRQSRRIGRVGQLEGTLACTLRNAALRLVPARASDRALRRIASQPL
jgi:2-polyprenyl-6-methoxyphenol hydroxylase-like FAD-dependent oxidoreductase